MDDKNISFLSCIDDKMATLSAQERGLQAQNTYKKRQISPFGVRKPVFFVEVSKRVRDASIYASKKYRSSFYS